MRDLDAALAAWRALLGDERVQCDPDTRRAASTATYATTEQVAAVLRLTSTAEVSEALRIATERNVPVYPVSRGCNWGLGSRVPTVDGAVLLDLSAMRTITDFDDALGCVTVEPGVTFAQMHTFLAERGARWFGAVTGSSPHASLVGNALERGDGAGPYGDRWNHVCALEAVLATGEVVRTGFARFDGAKAAQSHRWGVGPSLDGLFSQSNLAVVTRMTVWLSPLPKSIQAMRFRLRDGRRLAPLVDALRTLRLDGTLRATASLWNARRAWSVEARAHDREGWARFVRETDGCAWFGLTGLYAPTALMGRALREHAVATLGPLVDSWHVEERSGDPVAGRELLWEHEPAFGFLQGVPHARSLQSAYWSKPADFTVEGDADPDRDRCGVVWCCAAVPLRGDDVARACELAAHVLHAHGFDPMLAVATPTERCASLLPTILCAREVPDADARAVSCPAALTAALAREGWLPYRVAAHRMASIPEANDATRALLARLRAAVDPSGVLAPGRYER